MNISSVSRLDGVENKEENKALVNLLIGIGDELGLFEELAAHGSATIPQLAARTELNEAYVSEWLRAMVEAGRLEHDPVRRLYAIPAVAV